MVIDWPKDTDSMKVTPAQRRKLPPATGRASWLDHEVMECSRVLVKEIRRLRKRHAPSAITIALLSVTAGSLRALHAQGAISRRDAAEYLRYLGTYVLRSPAKPRKSKSAQKASRKRGTRRS